MMGAVGGAVVPRRNAFQLSGLRMFLSDTQGRIGAHAPWPILPWAGGRNPDGIREGVGEPRFQR